MVNFPGAGSNPCGQIPMNYDMLNLYSSAYSPSTLHCQNSALTQYFMRYLLQKAISVFKWTVPEEWDMNYFLYTLYCWGYICVFYHDRYGVIPQGCGLYGYNIFYQPTEAYIVNPVLKGQVTRKINKDCVIFRLQPDWRGILDIVMYYADNMALTAESCEINIANSKLSYMFGVDNKQQAESMKKIMDEIMKGQSSVFYGNNLRRRNANGDTTEPWTVFAQNLRDNFIAPDLQDTLRRWEEMFCNEIGINNVRSDKKERLITAEAESNDFEARSKCELWLEELQKCCNKVNEMFADRLTTPISVDWRVRNVETSGNIFSGTIYNSMGRTD